MTLRYDTLSSLIDQHNKLLLNINAMTGSLDAILTAIEANGDYATQTSAGTKTIINDNQAAIVSANATFLSIPSE
jgi:hypothetical protein